MNITIKRAELDALKGTGFKEVDEFLRYNDWNSAASLKLDISTISEDQMLKIVKVLSKDKVRNASPLSVIDQLKRARENPKDQRAKTLDQFATMLKEYIATFPKYHIYKQTEEGEWKAYAASKIGYCPPKKHKYGVEAAYVWMHAAYYQRGAVTSTSFTWHWEEVKGKTVSQVLADSGIMAASKELDAQYEKELARYKELRGAIGRQMWGSGYADSVDSDSWRSRGSFSLDVDGRKARVVIDSHIEGTDKKKSEATEGEAPTLDGSFWKRRGREEGKAPDDDDSDEVDDNTEVILEVPIRPEVIIFSLEKHEQAWAHVNRLEDYVYDKTLGAKLVLPQHHRELIDILVDRDRAEMNDIISGKAGGSIVLCSGVPGTGKTLTAEVFAETIERPLYVVASSQLGTSAESLESELKTVLNRAARLGAIMLIDEADVFIHERGESMTQNAVVGVFLRVLEYYQGVMFLTTNRATIVDDAIISRCTAQVKFEIPSPDGQKKIWGILAGLSDIKLSPAELEKFVKKHKELSGRDVKGILKLANLIATRRKSKIDCAMLEYVMQFKPTYETSSAKQRGE